MTEQAGAAPNENATQQNSATAFPELAQIMQSLQTHNQGLQERFQDTMDSILSAYARAKIQKLEIMNHNGAMLGHVNKLAVANAAGLSEKQRLGVTPYPSPSIVNVQGGSDVTKELSQLKEQLKQIQDDALDKAKQQNEELLANNKANEDALRLTIGKAEEEVAKAKAAAEEEAAKTVAKANDDANRKMQQAQAAETKAARKVPWWTLPAVAALSIGGGAVGVKMLSTPSTQEPPAAATSDAQVDLEVEGWQTNSNPTQ